MAKADDQNSKRDDELLTTEDLARTFNLAVSTFKKWRMLGIGPAWYWFGVKDDGEGPGNCVVRYRRCEVESYIRLHRVTPGSSHADGPVRSSGGSKRSNVHRDNDDDLVA